MAHQYSKHFTREEATALLPQIRDWLHKLREARAALEVSDKRLNSLMHSGQDLGGDLVNRWVKLLAEMQETLGEFRKREIQIKDLDRGLIDFPAIIGGREVFLCWEQDEETVEFWHDLETGYGGRERI